MLGPFGANIVARALLVGTPGTANLIDEQNVTHANVPLQQGYNPIDGIIQVAPPAARPTTSGR